METLKYFYRNYKKEIILISIIILCILSGIMFCIYYSGRSEVDSVNVSLLGNTQEEILQEKIVEDANSLDVEVINVQVDIKGEVKNPGVYVVTEDSRVIDVINVAGGLTKNADTKVNNLSRKVKDEMVIIIYSKDEVKNFKTIKEEENDIIDNSKEYEDIIINDSSLNVEDILTNQDIYDSESEEVDNSEVKISINTASKEQLMTLSGIGAGKAEAIINYRLENGNFEKIEDIMNVSGIGESVFAKIKDFITI